MFGFTFCNYIVNKPNRLKETLGLSVLGIMILLAVVFAWTNKYEIVKTPTMRVVYEKNGQFLQEKDPNNQNIKLLLKPVLLRKLLHYNYKLQKILE